MFLDDAQIVFPRERAHGSHIWRVRAMLRGEFLARELTDAAIARSKRCSTSEQYLRRAAPDDDADLESLGWIGWSDHARLRDCRALASLEDH
jgi:hypothetical protein